MAAPLCGANCIDQALYRSLATCNYSYACSCQSPDFVASFYSCANAACSAADVEAWTRYAQTDCAAFGVVWSSSAPSPASTPVVTEIATSTSVATAVVVISTAVTSFAASASAAASAFFGLTTGVPFPLSSSSSPNDAVSSPTIAVSAPTNVISNPVSPPSGSSLSTGAIAGISVGVTAIFVIAVVLFLLWHRRRQQAGATPVAAVSDNQTGRPDQDWNVDKEAKTAVNTTVTSVQFPPELPNEQARPAYKTAVSPIDPPHPPLSPSPPYVEIAGPLPSEIAATPPPAPAPLHHHAPLSPPPGFAEADSTALSANITSPLSELEQPAFIYHELASSSSAGPPAFARELPAERSLGPSAAVPVSAPAPAFVDDAAAADDAELARLKAEIEALRVEKERVRLLQSMEEHERDLSRQIVQAELRAAQRKSGGGGGGGGPS